MKHNVILTGFMGTGKTSLGKMLATKLGRPFVDIDKKIERAEHLSIPKIFERYGEEHFRELERAAVRELSSKRGLVIATGGGTIKDAENFRLLKSSGIVICLTADPEEIFRRTARRGERPVLDSGGSERLATIKKLLAERKEFYDRADYHVDTTDWSPLQIVEDICRYLRQFR
ncbi:MAG: AAA family ATPase [Selenomonadaceae bacterium]|nr:AAA family ATPase [Selenomonadaceae bacterium]